MRLSSSRCPVVGDLVLLASSGGGELGKKTQTVALATQADVDAKRFGMRDVVGLCVGMTPSALACAMWWACVLECSQVFTCEVPLRAMRVRSSPVHL